MAGDINNSSALNINTTTAKGLEKVIGLITRFLIDIQIVVNQILFGKGGRNQNTKGIQRAIQKGLVKTIEELASIDFCNLLNYVSNIGSPKTGSFKPSGPSPGATPFQKRLWTVQNYAYKIQKSIDRFYTEFGGSSTSTGKSTGLGIVISDINESMEFLLSEENGLNDPEILREFPEMANATNYLRNALDEFNSYLDITNINQEKLQETLKFIDNVRSICVTIVTLNPVQALGSITSLIFNDKKIQEDYKQLQEFITPGPKVIGFLTDLVNRLNRINDIAKKILSYVTLIQTLIRIFTILIKIFNVLKAFLVTLPIPNLLTWMGLNQFVGKTFEEVLKEQGEKKFISRLSQINFVVILIIIIATSLIVAIDRIIIALTNILNNIRACNRDEEQIDDFASQQREDQNNQTSQQVSSSNPRRGFGSGRRAGGTTGTPPGAATQPAQNPEDRSPNLNENPLDALAVKIEDTLRDLRDNRDRLQSFIDGYNNKKNLINKTFFGYTIDIVTEELADEGITLRRRYGIARSPENIIVVESTPTFASLDLIIINEVKALLVSKGFVTFDFGNPLNASARETSRAPISQKGRSRGAANPQTVNSGIGGSELGGTGRTSNRSQVGAGSVGPSSSSTSGELRGSRVAGLPLSGLNIDQSEILIESLNFLGDSSNITLEDIEGGLSTSDILDQINISDLLGDPDLSDFGNSPVATIAVDLNKFVSSLPGGRKFRQKTRETTIKNNQKLVKDLKAQDPTGSSSQGIVQSKEKENERLKILQQIDELEGEKDKLTALLVTLIANPPAAAAVRIKIKNIDKEIDDLKNKLN